MSLRIYLCSFNIVLLLGYSFCQILTDSQQCQLNHSFYDLETKQCQPCWEKNCIQCIDSSPSSCIACSPGFSLQLKGNIQSCVQKCTHFAQTNSEQVQYCSTCIENQGMSGCFKCKNESYCQQCQPNYVNIDGKCKYSQCKIGEVFDIITQKCSQICSQNSHPFYEENLCRIQLTCPTINLYGNYSPELRAIHHQPIIDVKIYKEYIIICSYHGTVSVVKADGLIPIAKVRIFPPEDNGSNYNCALFGENFVCVLKYSIVVLELEKGINKRDIFADKSFVYSLLDSDPLLQTMLIKVGGNKYNILNFQMQTFVEIKELKNINYAILHESGQYLIQETESQNIKLGQQLLCNFDFIVLQILRVKEMEYFIYSADHYIVINSGNKCSNMGTFKNIQKAQKVVILDQRYVVVSDYVRFGVYYSMKYTNFIDLKSPDIMHIDIIPYGGFSQALFGDDLALITSCSMGELKLYNIPNRNMTSEVIPFPYKNVSQIYDIGEGRLLTFDLSNNLRILTNKTGIPLASAYSVRQKWLYHSYPVNYVFADAYDENYSKNINMYSVDDTLLYDVIDKKPIAYLQIASAIAMKEEKTLGYLFLRKSQSIQIYNYKKNIKLLQKELYICNPQTSEYITDIFFYRDWVILTCQESLDEPSYLSITYMTKQNGAIIQQQNQTLTKLQQENQTVKRLTN